jgi:hypothetical protein
MSEVREKFLKRLAATRRELVNAAIAEDFSLYDRLKETVAHMEQFAVNRGWVRLRTHR